MAANIPSGPFQTIKRQQAWKQGSDFAGKALIDGFLKGDLHARAVVVGPTGTVMGNIYADQAEIGGRVHGNIGARKVQLRASSHVRGIVLAGILEVEGGADFEGKCRSLTRQVDQLRSEARRSAAPSPLPLAAE